ncbi:hypothetical protein F7230_02440 [Corynebacterium sp. 320]|uniref:SPW repeat-containing protein n=1 Tax=Corynebacterium zhongnanshanii TaxID=2768834 RepID=A0ABQ6VFI4_9CORY|nr:MULTISPECIES: hypothetical protein [Corynebacterium]KAB1503982.1 hypothetical protein F7230_02440 [Corynebacterium sp. 320]KAB1552919.1 hypothetical protein F7233_04155 [Corynebacterium sp. 321]KAB1553862.1 hypothetical protein F7232_02425 [Corynebacterium sp. 319]KAB3528118.1 hypothetical protein F8354_02440 [Corynebacterium sp. 250]KAB3540394.1 hypothetical protein F8390_03900 [Corynebacterium sp. 366]
MHKDTSEPHWGDPTRSQARRDVTRKETIMGLSWLSVGILFGLFVEILYVGSRITVGGTGIPVPWTILFAFFFNRSISRIAKLWTDNPLVAAIPFLLWTFGFIALTAWPTVGITGDQLVPQTVWSILVFIAGLAGGAWPLRPRFPDLGTPQPTAATVRQTSK